MEQRLTIITLGVSDLDRSAEFYENIFGWRRMDSGDDNIIFFQLDGIMLSLYNRNKLAEDANVGNGGTGFKGFTLSYNVRSENEVDELFQHFQNNGVTLIKKPQHVFWGGYSSYIADPDGFLWEIAYNPYAIPDPLE